MPDKVKQVTSTETDEMGTNEEITNTTDRVSTTTVKQGGKTSSTTFEDIAFQIQFTIPVRGGLGTSDN